MKAEQCSSYLQILLVKLVSGFLSITHERIFLVGYICLFLPFSKAIEKATSAQIALLPLVYSYSDHVFPASLLGSGCLSNRYSNILYYCLYAYVEFEVYFNFWLSKLCICAHLLVSSFQVLRCGAQSSLMYFLLFLFRTRSSCIDFNSRYFIIDMLELWNFHNLLLLWVVTKMLAQAITWSAEHIGGGKCIFQKHSTIK